MYVTTRLICNNFFIHILTKGFEERAVFLNWIDAGVQFSERILVCSLPTRFWWSKWYKTCKFHRRTKHFDEFALFLLVIELGVRSKWKYCFNSDMQLAFCMTCCNFYWKMRVIFDELVIHVRTNKIFEERTVFLPVPCGRLFVRRVVIFTERLGWFAISWLFMYVHINIWITHSLFKFNRCGGF